MSVTPRMPNSIRRPGLVLALLVALAPGAGAGTLVPNGAAAPSMQATGRLFDVTQRAVRLRVEPLDAVQVADWFRTRTRTGQEGLRLDAVTGESPDGGAEPPARRGKKRTARPLVVMAVSIENGAGEDVTFVPEMCSLVDQHEVETSPLPGDYVREMFRAIFAATEDPDRLADESMLAVHADAVILKPGQRVSRLLIFSPLDPGAKTVTLQVRHLAVGQSELHPVFPFLITE